MINEWQKTVWLFNRGYNYDYIAQIFECTADEIKECEEEAQKRGFHLKDPSTRNKKISFKREYLPVSQNSVPIRIREIPKKWRALDDTGIEEETDIIETLAEKFGLLREGVEAHTRSAQSVEARDSIVFLLRKYGELSYPVIGYIIGRDHTTIIHAYQKMEHRFQGDPTQESKLIELISVELVDKVKMIKNGKLKMATMTSSPRQYLEINTGSEIRANSLIHFGDQEKINQGKTSYKKYLEEYKKEIKEVRETRMLAAKQTIENLRKWRKKNGMKELDHVKINWSLAKDS